MNPHCSIVVVDDATKTPVNKKYIDHYEKNPYNFGKQKWYKTVNILWNNALKTNSDYYIMMVDDSLPNEGFFEDAIRLWESIDDPKKIAMHLANNGRLRNWTNFDRRDYNDDIFWTQTTETSFISKVDFIGYRIPNIPKSRWKGNKALGSGVFPLINRYWVGQNRTIYGVKKSLLHANEECGKSQMNYNERIKNPWILK